MKKLIGYLKSSIYNIGNNKLYSAFYIIGTALAFVFIILLLQYYKMISVDTEPVVNTERLFVGNFPVERENGEKTYLGIVSSQLPMLEENIPGKELLGVSESSKAGARLGERFLSVTVDFVGKDYFDIYQFNFIEGRPFTHEEMDAGDRVAIIKKGLAERYFPNGKAIGAKIRVKNVEYEVVGIIDEFSKFSAPNIEGNIWLPYNKSKPHYFTVCIQFKPGMAEQEMKQQLSDALQPIFSGGVINYTVDIKSLRTVREQKMEDAGVGSLAIGGVIALLLLIPALNIVTLNMTNAYTRAEEVAIRRAIGSTRLAVFFQQMAEIFILVLIGLILGILLALPVVDGIQNFLLGSASQDQISLIAHLDYSVILCQIVPLAILFAFLSGGIPVYMITRMNIASTLKGEEDKL